MKRREIWAAHYQWTDSMERMGHWKILKVT